jgi:hypothetical protein
MSTSKNGSSMETRGEDETRPHPRPRRPRPLRERRTKPPPAQFQNPDEAARLEPAAEANAARLGRRGDMHTHQKSNKVATLTASPETPLPCSGVASHWALGQPVHGAGAAVQPAHGHGPTAPRSARKGIARCSTLLPIRGPAGMPSSLSDHLLLVG